MNVDDPELQRPDEEAIREITEKTRAALEKSVSQKVAAAMPVRAADKLAPAQYIRYTPSQQGVAFNSGAKQRVIRMLPLRQKTVFAFTINLKMTLPLFLNQMTVKEQQEWKIPPCISNWKNAKGYTIPLDKRLAADGRGLQTRAVTISPERGRKRSCNAKSCSWNVLTSYQQAGGWQAGEPLCWKGPRSCSGQYAEYKPAACPGNSNAKGIQSCICRSVTSELQRNENRDISEVIALGVPNPRPSNEIQYDQRLFNQSKGMDSGFAGGEDEIYNVYDQPWRSGKDMAQNIYRPSKNVDKDMYGDDLEARIKTNRFVPDKEFSNSDRNTRGRGRDGPVQFEEDPFGLDKFLEEAKQHGGSKRPSDSSRPKEHEHESKKRRKD
ncbi:SNW1 protein, partial [Oxylabes madagascariensis]|nr:SNW1 protein [Oxylabes madagascariensis]